MSFSRNRFCGKRPAGVAINKALQNVYLLEFKQSIDRDGGFLELNEAEANEQPGTKASWMRSEQLRCSNVGI